MIFAELLGAGIGLVLLVGLLALLILIFEIVMFIDVVLNKNITNEARILWAVGMLLIHPFVAVAYYFTDHKKRGL